ncbi:PH domain-containing protein [Anaeromyxobacter oryzae]|nr:PH domain-containing protein [Anaeromyxobacter oryzae]
MAVPARARRRRFPPWSENRRVAAVFAIALAAAVALPLSGLLHPDGRPDPGAALRLGGLAAWAAAVMIVARWPPRARARREDLVPVLRRSAVRRFSGVAFAGPLAALVALRDDGALGPAAKAFAVAVLVGLAALDLVARPRAFRLLPEGIEVLRAGSAAGLLRWDAIRAVHVEEGRRYAGVVLHGDRGAVAVSAWLDGSAELAAVLLARAPPRALAGPGVRDGLEALAADPRLRPRGGASPEASRSS